MLMALVAKTKEVFTAELINSAHRRGLSEPQTLESPLVLRGQELHMSSDINPILGRHRLPGLAVDPSSEGPTLYSSSERELERVSAWLSDAPDQFIVRITGGCLPLKSDIARKIQSSLTTALSEFQDGILISGATRSLRDDGLIRPCMPEIGARVQQNMRDGCHLGVFPGASLSPLSGNSLLVARDTFEGKDWNVVVDSRVPRAIAASFETPYLWDAEWQTVLKVLNNQRTGPDFRGALVVSFDGGPATERELRAWAEVAKEDPRIKLLLITGSSAERSTDKLANNHEWRAAHENIYTVSLHDSNLIKVLSDIGVFRASFNGRKDSAFPA